MKRFLLFCCDRYYPMGGWSDLVGSYASLPESVEIAKGWEPASGFGEWHVVDFQTGKIVERGSGNG